MLKDHPDIASTLRTGYESGREPQYPRCPICDAECDTVYLNKDMEVIGCAECVRTADAWDCGECFPEKE